MNEWVKAWGDGGSGETLKQARKAKGLRLKDVAERCGCSIQYVHHVEHGIAYGNDDVLRCMVRELDLPSSWLDWHAYQWGRIAPDLLHFGDHGHIKACLRAFREAVLS